MSNEHDHSQNECCSGHGHDAKRQSISTLDSSFSANTETVLRVAGVDCAEEVAIIERA